MTVIAEEKSSTLRKSLKLTENQASSTQPSTACMNEPSKPSSTVIQIENQQDLLKYLLQNASQAQDPSNPNKNVINIISINICNKNEGDNNVTTNNFKTGAASLPAMNNNNLMKKVTSSLNNSQKPPVINKQEIRNSPVKKIPTHAFHNLKNDLGFNINGAICSSAPSSNFEKDFYEASESNTYFSHGHSGGEMEGLFDWN